MASTRRRPWVINDYLLTKCIREGDPMGCDIHLYNEKKVNGKWITADANWGIQYPEEDPTPDVPYEERYSGRDYDLFGYLANVRKDSEYAIDPRGLPEDVCLLVKTRSDQWDCDGHSHSYLTFTELQELATHLLLDPPPDSHWTMRSLQEIMGHFAGMDGEDHRIVFWFDN